MDRMLPALLAVTLLLVATSGALAANGETLRDPVPVTHDETPSVLLLDSHNRTDAATPEPDLSAALQSQEARLDGRFAEAKFDAEYLASTGTDARRALIERTFDDLSRETAAIRAAAARAHAEYVAGDLTSQAYLERLAVLDTRARAKLALLDPWDPPGPNLLTEDQYRDIWEMRIQLAPFSGTLRHQTARAVEGDLTDERREETRLFLAASGDGLALSTFRDGQFVREVYRPDNAGTGDVLGGTDVDVRERSDELYPWISDDGVGSVDIRRGQHVGKVSYTKGAGAISLTAIIDKRTGRVFYEQQRKVLSSIPVEATVRTDSPGLTMVVYWPYPGGPLGVQLTQAGAPRSGTVTVNGTEIRQYGDAYWTLPPTDDRQQVAGTYGGVTLNATVVSNATAQGWYP